jgi:hypothetical protein
VLLFHNELVEKLASIIFRRRLVFGWRVLPSLRVVNNPFVATLRKAKGIVLATVNCKVGFVAPLSQQFFVNLRGGHNNA